MNDRHGPTSRCEPARFLVFRFAAAAAATATTATAAFIGCRTATHSHASLRTCRMEVGTLYRASRILLGDRASFLHGLGASLVVFMLHGRSHIRRMKRDRRFAGA